MDWYDYWISALEYTLHHPRLSPSPSPRAVNQSILLKFLQSTFCTFLVVYKSKTFSFHQMFLILICGLSNQFIEQVSHFKQVFTLKTIQLFASFYTSNFIRKNLRQQYYLPINTWSKNCQYQISLGKDYMCKINQMFFYNY